MKYLLIVVIGLPESYNRVRVKYFNTYCINYMNSLITTSKFQHANQLCLDSAIVMRFWTKVLELVAYEIL